MNNVKAYINSTTLDTYRQFGVQIAETSVTALMTPVPMKGYVTNKSAKLAGKQVLTDGGNMPKVDERDVQLVMSLEADSLAQFFVRYRTFCDVLKSGKIDLMVEICEGSTFIKETYHLTFISCSQYSEFNGRLAKFVLKFNEPDPTNRTLETSPDIVL